jgi:hypothetical protein
MTGGMVFLLFIWTPLCYNNILGICTKSSNLQIFSSNVLHPILHLSVFHTSTVEKVKFGQLIRRVGLQHSYTKILHRSQNLILKWNNSCILFLLQRAVPHFTLTGEPSNERPLCTIGICTCTDVPVLDPLQPAPCIKKFVPSSSIAYSKLHTREDISLATVP